MGEGVSVLARGDHVPVLLYLDPDVDHRCFADAVLRSEHRVVAAESLEVVDEPLDASVIVVDLSHVDPVATIETVKARWPAAPIVVVLAPDAPLGHDHTSLWELGPASIVVNPLAPGALRDGIAKAVS